MTNWELASKLLATAPKTELCAYDAAAMPGARLIAAVEMERRTREAIRKEDLKQAAEKANAEMEAMKVEQRTVVATQIRRHFKKLCGDATRDALRPAPRGAVLWMQPEMHAAMSDFVGALGTEVRVVDGRRWREPCRGVVGARVGDAADALDRLREAFETSRAARECMRNVHRRRVEVLGDAVAVR